MSERRRMLAAIMFTDMVGYTALAQKDEAQALESLETHRELLRPVFSRHNGREIKAVGDSFLVEFSSALEAVLCAIEVQSVLNSVRLERGKKLLVRIGIHLGDVIREDGDVYGDAVNIASRIEPLAEAGGVCISEQVYAQVKNKIAFPLSKLPRPELKNVSDTIDVYRLTLPWEYADSQMPKARATSRNRIAVLPFANISPDPADAYLADGMTEELISTLSGIRGLDVVSRTSVMQYRSSTKRTDEISKDLNAATLLEGSVRKSANKVRIAVQLIDAVEDKHLWAEEYDRELGDIFAVQAEIAQHVARALSTELLSSTKERITRGSTNSTRAHTAYLKGRYHLSRLTNEDLQKALNHLEQAVSEDPNFGYAYAALSDCYTYLAGSALSEREAFPKAKKYALKAVELDDLLAEGHASLGIVALQYDWDWPKAELELRRALDLNPSDSTARLWFGVHLILVRRFNEGISELTKAEELDPLSPLIKLNLGLGYYRVRRYDDASGKLRESVDLEEGIDLAHWSLGMVYVQKSMFDEALKELNLALTLGQTSLFAFGLGGLGYAQAISGQKEEAMETLNKLTGRAQSGTAYSTEIAMIHIGLGETDRALEFLEKAFEQRESWLVLTYGFPVFDSLLTNPRYVRLIEKIGLPL